MQNVSLGIEDRPHYLYIPPFFFFSILGKNFPDYKMCPSFNFKNLFVKHI